MTHAQHNRSCDDRAARRLRSPACTALSFAAVAALIPLGSCGSTRPLSSFYEPRTLDARDRLRAEQLCDQAEPLMASAPDAAEALLLQALAADTFSGRSHNNLGVIYLAQGRLYDAATSFESARRLLPDNPDPRINLGLTLEHAGRIDEAIDAYAAAHDLNAHHLGAMQALARAQLRYRRADDRTPVLLAEIALRADEPWRTWAIEQSKRPIELEYESRHGPRQDSR